MDLIIMRLNKIFIMLFALSVTANAETFIDTGSVAFHSKGSAITCIGWKTKQDAPAGIPYVGCSVPGEFITHHYKPKEECDADWGGNFSVPSKGRAIIECATDAYGGSEGNYFLLTTGKVVRGDGWMCKGVGKDGIECRNLDGNGFSLSSKRQVLLNKHR